MSEKPIVCGLIMPIGSMTDIDKRYTEDHWAAVRHCINRALETSNFKCQMVSESEETHVIQKTIVTNLSDLDIVICDISGRNPNVMLELGLRLAFDRPVVVIKDDLTTYPFDTSPLSYEPYESSLNLMKIEPFMEKLPRIVSQTYERFKDGGSPFLSSFGSIVPKKPETEVVDSDEYLQTFLRKIDEKVTQLAISSKPPAAFEPARHRSFGSFTDNVEIHKYRALFFPDEGSDLREFIADGAEKEFKQIAETLEPRIRILEFSLEFSDPALILECFALNEEILTTELAKLFESESFHIADTVVENLD